MTKEIKPNWQPTGLIQSAFKLAAKKHATQANKGSGIPYLTHLLAVSSLVIEYGGTEDQAAAALLHDVLEDTKTSYKEVKKATNKKVADMVDACSSKKFGEKNSDPWVVKKRYLEKLKDKKPNDPSLLVALSDKVHNAERTVNEYPKTPTAQKKYWSKFNAGYDIQKLWYTSLYKGLNAKGTLPPALLKRLQVAIKILFN
jgi:(p)ppGpp synthase/HD superfamily hydrolase